MSNNKSGFLNKMTSWFEKWIGPIAEFTNTNIYLTSISDAFTMQMPLIIVGSFALLLNIFICSGTGLAKYESLAWLANYGRVFSTINYACISCMALWTCVLIAYSLGKKKGLKPEFCAVLSAVCFLILTNQENIGGNLGASALFLGFFVGILSIFLYGKLMSYEKIKIKMDASVPPMIASSFNSLIPVAITLLFFGLVAGVLYGTTQMYLNEIVYKVIQVPFNQVVGSQLGVSIIIILSQLLWWMGIHGHMAMNVVAKPVRQAAIAANMEAVAAGLLPTQWYTLAYVHTFTNLGGGGVVISLAISILLFSKRSDRKDITKVSMIPLICGISEPMVFGLPIMLNPIYIIPFVLTPLICGNIGYYAQVSGFLTPSYVESIPGMPMFIQQFLAYSGQWQAIVLTILVILIGVIIYTPFVLIDNAQAKKEEENNNAI